MKNYITGITIDKGYNEVFNIDSFTVFSDNSFKEGLNVIIAQTSTHSNLLRWGLEISKFSSGINLWNSVYWGNDTELSFSVSISFSSGNTLYKVGSYHGLEKSDAVEDENINLYSIPDKTAFGIMDDLNKHRKFFLTSQYPEAVIDYLKLFKENEYDINFMPKSNFVTAKTDKNQVLELKSSYKFWVFNIIETLNKMNDGDIIIITEPSGKMDPIFRKKLLKYRDSVLRYVDNFTKTKDIQVFYIKYSLL